MKLALRRASFSLRLTIGRRRRGRHWGRRCRTCRSALLRPHPVEQHEGGIHAGARRILGTHARPKAECRRSAERNERRSLDPRHRFHASDICDHCPGHSSTVAARVPILLFIPVPIAAVGGVSRGGLQLQAEVAIKAIPAATIMSLRIMMTSNPCKSETNDRFLAPVRSWKSRAIHTTGRWRIEPRDQECSFLLVPLIKGFLLEVTMALFSKAFDWLSKIVPSHTIHGTPLATLSTPEPSETLYAG